MLKINVGLSRKLTADFNSQGFSLNIEGELPSDILYDEKSLRQSTERLFQVANLMLDEQVDKAGKRTQAKPQEDSVRPDAKFQPSRSGHSGNGATRNSHNGNGHNGHSSVDRNGNGATLRQLTQAQGRAIRNMAAKLDLDADQWTRDELGVNRVEELSIKQASVAIDELRQKIESAGQGVTR